MLRNISRKNNNLKVENVKLVSTSDFDELEILNYFKMKPTQTNDRSNTISSYQTCIMIMTITAISAVDFKKFPSRFRKSKTYGLSLVRNNA